MEEWKIALAWIGVMTTLYFDSEDKLYKLTHGNKTNVFTILKKVEAIVTLVYSILGFLGKI